MNGNERYARQMILPEISEDGQARLARARVLVVGVGALGTPALYYLAAAGVGTLGIADDDSLELSNLHRQILYQTADIGRFKVEAAGERLAAFNPETTIEVHRLRVSAGNAVALFRDYDLVLDCTDRLETKFLINDACAKAERPLVHAAVLGFEARVAVFHAHSGPCLRCLFPEPSTTPALTCSQAGVLGAVTGMAGSLQALEAIKWILAASCEEESPSNSPFLASRAKGRTGGALLDGGKGENAFSLPLGRAAAKGEREGDSGATQKESPSNSPFLASRAKGRTGTAPTAPIASVRGRNEYENSLQGLLGRLWLMDGRTLATRVIELPRDPACRICRHDPESIELTRDAAPVQHIAANELERHPEALLIDVREDDEWAAGHLDGALHCPLSRLIKSPPDLPDRETYIAYCAHGIRSETAARLLRDAGFENVFSLSGGIAAIRADRAVENKAPAQTTE